MPAFWLKGAAFYVFLLAVLIWSEAIARRLQTLEKQAVFPTVLPAHPAGAPASHQKPPDTKFHK
jgi:hypothetical protein